MPDAGDFGARLRAAREARGITLKQIAASTKISPLTLEALERQDVSRLPGGLFSRGFVRAYAKEVGLDPERTVREFAERFGDDDDPVMSEAAIKARAARSEHDPARSRGGWRWVGLLITVILVAAIFVVQRYLTRQIVVTHAPEPKSAVVPAPQPPPAPAPVLPDPAAVPAATVPATVPASDQGQIALSPTAAGQATVPEGGGQEAVTEASPAALRVALSVDSACWVSAKADGKQVVRRTLQAGERVELAAADTIMLTVGNPAAVVYTVNGMPGHTLGPANQVATVLINTSNAQTFTR